MHPASRAFGTLDMLLKSRTCLLEEPTSEAAEKPGSGMFYICGRPSTAIGCQLVFKLLNGFDWRYICCDASETYAALRLAHLLHSE
jgi:hypothetical protein